MTAIGDLYNCGPAGDCSGGSDIGVYVMLAIFVISVIIIRYQDR